MPPDIHAQILRLATEIFRLCVWLVLLAAIFTPLERYFGAAPRPADRKGFSVDVGYYFLNNLFSVLLQIPPLVVLGWALHFLVPANFYDFVGSLPLWLRVVAGLAIGMPAIIGATG